MYHLSRSHNRARLFARRSSEMNCQLCHRDSGEAQYCDSCVAVVTRLLSKKPNTPQHRAKPVVIADNRFYWLLVACGGLFQCVVDGRGAPSEPEAIREATRQGSLEAWYCVPTSEAWTEPQVATTITAKRITHNEFCNWIHSGHQSQQEETRL